MDVTVARVLSIGVVMTLARPGQACEPASAVDKAALISDGNGTDFPINVVPTVMYHGSGLVLLSPGLALLDDQQHRLDATVMSLQEPGFDRVIYAVVPAQPLMPNTDYALGDTVQSQCYEEPCTTPFGPKFPFKTGASTDTTPPAVPPAPVVANRYNDICDDDACCGPYHDIVIWFERPTVDAVRYDLYDGDQLVASNAPLNVRVSCYVGFNPTEDSVPLDPGRHQLSFHAFDLAGNEAVGTETLELSVDCDGLDGSGCNAGGGVGWIPCAVAAFAMSRRRISRSQLSG